MAEETLVKEPLTAGMIQEGAQLISELDRRNVAVLGSYWWFDAENNRWKLMLVLPDAVANSPRQAYQSVAEALEATPPHLLELQYITVIAPDHPLVRALATLVPTGLPLEGIRLSRQALAGRYIDDLYLYRLLPEATAA